MCATLINIKLIQLQSDACVPCHIEQLSYGFCFPEVLMHVP